MNSQPPFPVADSQHSAELLQKRVETSASQEHPESRDEDPPLMTGSEVDRLFHQLSQFSDKDKLLFLQQFLGQLNSKQLQTVLEFGQQELASRQTYKSASTTVPRETVLTLKKDYTYQDRGLSEPTQYYVYLRRRKPKLDRYIGTLFYLPSGCTLNYVSDASGNLLFEPPHNIFQLTDAKNPSLNKVVRLVRLVPPPPDYTFTKQQQDTPAIYLQIEYLEPLTFEAIAEQSLPFPSCMHEGGTLDRYRWDVTIVNPPANRLSSIPPVTVEILADRVLSKPSVQSKRLSAADSGSNKPAQVLNLPVHEASTFYLRHPANLAAILERLQLWVTWSEKAMPQSKWAIAQTNEVYILMNANFQRSILSISTTAATVTLHGSLAVTVKWFHDLTLAVSQAQNQRRYTFNQLKLAHDLFVEMSLPQTDSLKLLKTLFGVEFSRQ